MKNKRISFLLLTTTFLSLGFFSLAFSKNIEAAKAEVGSYTTDTDIDTYYSNFDFTLTGQKLFGKLHDLITSTHRKYTSYNDLGINLYQQYTDQYYDSDNNPVEGYIFEFYSGAKWEVDWIPNTQGGYNREHLWCQSLSNGLWEESGGGADMHHLRPVEKGLNSSRSNNLYASFEDLGLSRDDYKVYADKETNDDKYALGGYNHDGYFEPLDNKKGDVARIVLYLYTHYNTYTNSIFGDNASGDGDNGNSSYFGNLPITNLVYTPEGTTESALELLVSWSNSDLPDYGETQRNNVIAVYQGNRNPFIDFPDFANAIWGEPSSGGDSGDTGGDSGDTGEVDPAKEINVGDTVILTCKGASMELSSVDGIGNAVAYSNNVNNVYPLEVCSGATTGTYAFKNSDNSYLSWSSGNSLNVSDTLDNNSSWTVNIDSSGNATILNANTPARQLLWNVHYPRFACYEDKSVGSSYFAVQFYIVEEENVDVIESITMSQSSANLNVEDSLTLSVSATPSDIDFTLTWTSSDETVATVSDAGLVTTLKEGTTTITATINENPSIYATCLVTVSTSGGEVTPPSSEGRSQLVNIFPSLANEVDTGQYIIAANVEGTYYVMNEYGSKFTSYNPTSLQEDGLANYAKTFTKNNSYFTITNTDSSYIGYGSSTNFNTIEENWSLEPYNEQQIKIVPQDDTSRCILYRASSNNVFGVYSQSNITTTGYYAPYLYKVDTALNLLIHNLTFMTCDDMLESSFNEFIKSLYDQLNDDELSYLSNVSISCSNGATYNALQAYNYALNEYEKTHTSKYSLIFKQNNEIYFTVIISFGASVAIFVVATKKRKKLD